MNQNQRSNRVQKNVHLILDRTKKIHAPKIVEPDDKPFEVRELIGLLDNSRKELMVTLHSLNDLSVLMEAAVKHPVFGELTLDQWVELIYLHEQRHIEQIVEIKLLLEE